MPVTLVTSSWSSGSLVFHESTSVAPSTTYNVFSIGTGAVKVGDTANDVDFQWYGTGSKSFILDLGAATMTLVGLATATDGAVTITNATESTSTTTGALIVSGGIANAKDTYLGDDVFLTSAAKLDWAAGNVTLTHATGKLTNSGALTNTGAVNIDDATESTSTTTGSLQTDGGLACVKDFYAGDDIFLTSGAVLNFNAGEATITHQSGNTQGKIKIDAALAAGAMDDGYGIHEVNLNTTGTWTGHGAASSSWANINSGTIPAGSYICARNDGVYEASGATITNAKIVFGARMQYIVTETDALRFPFSVNTGNMAITALIDINNLTDLGTVANAGATAATLLPICRDAGGTKKYVLLYNLA